MVLHIVIKIPFDRILPICPLNPIVQKHLLLEGHVLDIRHHESSYVYTYDQFSLHYMSHLETPV